MHLQPPLLMKKEHGINGIRTSSCNQNFQNHPRLERGPDAEDVPLDSGGSFLPLCYHQEQSFCLYMGILSYAQKPFTKVVISQTIPDRKGLIRDPRRTLESISGSE